MTGSAGCAAVPVGLSASPLADDQYPFDAWRAARERVKTRVRDLRGHCGIAWAEKQGAGEGKIGWVRRRKPFQADFSGVFGKSRPMLDQVWDARGGASRRWRVRISR